MGRPVCHFLLRSNLAGRKEYSRPSPKVASTSYKQCRRRAPTDGEIIAVEQKQLITKGSRGDYLSVGVI